jgi:cysteine sulfinate desulfinase/cysteine desulfurase-like protein
MGIGHVEAMGTVRLSLGHGNTAPEIQRAAQFLTRGFRQANS